MSPILLRQLHLYLGVFFAPAIIFFATTGLVQLLGLHEASRDGAYTPPAVIEKLSEVHIHQRYAAKPKRPGPPAAARPKAATPSAARPPQRSTLLPKAFFVATASGLILSSLLGLWMGLTQSRQRRLALVLLLAGLVLPVLLLVI